MRKFLSVPQRRRFYRYKRKCSRKADKLQGNNPVLIQNPGKENSDNIFKIEDYDIRQQQHY